MSRPRVAVAGLWHETNTYGPHVADLAAFQACELASGDAIIARHQGVRSVIGGFLDNQLLECAPTFVAGAWPSGPAPAATIDLLMHRLVEELSAVGAVDGVLLNLHGAMVAEDQPDVEAEVLRRVRSVLGDRPIAAVLDLHANPSVEFATQCDIAVCYDTYPHVDMWERGFEVAGLLAAAIDGRSLRTVIAKTPLLTCPLAQATDAEPMKGLQRRARSRGQAAGVARVSLAAGFAYSDVARAGMSVLVVADHDHEDAARVVAARTVDDIEARAADFAVSLPDPITAVRRALDPATPAPVILADVADNIGGGSAGDGTVLLRELVRQGASGALAIMADPEAVRRAFAAGEGAMVQTSLGGKSDRLHGEPLEVTALVVAISDGTYTTSGSWMTGQTFTMGTSALLDLRGIHVVVTTRPVPPFHREQVTLFGIDPAAYSVIVAKGAVAWRSAYGRDAATVIEVDTPGACPVDLTSLPRAASPVRIVPYI